jgi:hypothetical protein
VDTPSWWTLAQGLAALHSCPLTISPRRPRRGLVWLILPSSRDGVDPSWNWGHRCSAAVWMERAHTVDHLSETLETLPTRRNSVMLSGIHPCDMGERCCGFLDALCCPVSFYKLLNVMQTPERHAFHAFLARLSSRTPATRSPALSPLTRSSVDNMLDLLLLLVVILLFFILLQVSIPRQDLLCLDSAYAVLLPLALDWSFVPLRLACSSVSPDLCLPL